MAEPTSDILTGINPVEVLNMQHDTEARYAELFKSIDTTPPNITQPQLPDFHQGIVGPGDNINIDKNSYDYQLADFANLTKNVQKQYPDSFKFQPDLRIPQTETNRYIDEDFGYKLERDNEDFYASQQGAFKEIMKALFVKLPTYTFTKLGTGVGYLLGLVDPTNWGSNYIQKAGDNMIAKAFSDLEDNLKNDWLTTYRHTVDQNKGFFERAGTDLSFWTEDFVDGAAFLASAFVPGAIISKVGLGVKAAQLAELANGVEKSSALLTNLGKFSVKYGDRLFTTAVNTASESMFEAKGVRDKVFADLMATGKYSKDEATDIAAQKAKNSFLWNMAALSFSNAWETNLFYKALGKSAPSKIETKVTSLLEDYAAAGTAKKLGKLAYYSNKALQGALVEGFYEENIQLAIQRKNEGRNTYNGYFTVLGQLLQQTKDAIKGNDKEAAENIGMGALIGVIFGTGTSLATKEYSRDRIATERLVASLNEAKNNWLKVQDIYTVGPDGKIKEDKAKVAAAFLTQMKTANDLSEAQTIEHPILRNLAQKEIFSTFIASHLQQGSFDLLMKQLDNINTYKPEDLIKLGFDPKGDVAAQIMEYKNYAQRVANIKKSIDDKVVVTAPADLARKNYLFTLGSRQVALDQELNKVESNIGSLQSEIGYSSITDSLVDDLNSKQVKIKAQKKTVAQAEQEDIQDAQTKLDKYQSEYDNIVKDNEETIKKLKKDKNGFYFYEDDKKNKHPRVADLGQEIYFKAELENTIDDTMDEYNNTLTDRKDFNKKYQESLKVVQERLKEEAEKVKKAEEQKRAEEVKQTQPVPTETKKEPTTQTNEPVQAPVASQQERHDAILAKIPKTKNINVNLLNRLMVEVNQASIKGEISEDQESDLIAMLNAKNPIGTILDTEEDFKSEEEKIVTQEKSEDPKDNGFNPDTNTIQDINFEEETFSALAFRSSNKTVTQEEVEKEGSYVGVLDEDPYKVFKQGFLRYLIVNNLAQNQYKGLIIKDRKDLPRDRGSAKQTELGHVMVITDINGNIVYFDKDYNPSLNKTLGYQEIIYSFNKVAFKDLEEARALLGEQKTGIPLDQWLDFYKRQEEERELARILVDKGIPVPVSISGMAAGMQRQGTKPIDAKIALADQKYKLHIPQALESYDIKDPNKNKFVFNIDGQNLINGAIYIQTQRSENEPAVYTRIIPNKIGDNSKLFEDIKNVFLHSYKDENEANIAKDYLKKVLFLGYTNRPTIITTFNSDRDVYTLDLFENKQVIPKPDVVQFIADQRLNVTKLNINGRFNYYSIKDKKLAVDEIEDYNNFIIENSKTRARNIITTKGKVLMNINTYMMFNFDQGLETMQALAEGKEAEPVVDSLDDLAIEEIERRRQEELEPITKEIEKVEKEIEKIEKEDKTQGAYDFSASSNSGKWNSANNELLSLVQDNRKAFAIYKFLIGDMETFKEIVDFLNERGIEIPYTDRMKRADETMTAEERKSAIDSYNNSVTSKVEDKVQVEKDILSENNLQDETEYTPQELIEKYPLTGVQKVIWNLIKDIVNKLGIKVKFSSGRITEGFDGSNNPQNGEILIRPSTLKNGRFGEVLVHEVVHALTTKIISRVNSGVTTGLTQKQINAVKGLMKLFEAVKADNNLENKYPVKDVFEFIAHLTNEAFVKELESKDKTFLQKVVDFIADILGITNANELSKQYLKDIISDGTFLQEQGITVLASDYSGNLQGSKNDTKLRQLKDKLQELKEQVAKINAKYDEQINSLSQKITKGQNIAQLNNLPELIDKANKTKLSTQDKINLDNDPLAFFTFLKDQALAGNLAMMDKPENYGKEFMDDVLNFFNIKRDDSSLKKEDIKPQRRTRIQDAENQVDEEAKNQNKNEEDLFSGDLQARVTEEENQKLFLTDTEITKVNEMFGEKVARRVYGIINSSAYATWSTSGIKLFENAVVGTGYHEAWHHFSQMYLTIDQKRNLYHEVRMRNVEFKTRDGRTLKSLSSTDFDIEEFLADDFRDYVLSDGKSRFSNRPYRNTIFRRIVDFIRKFFFGGINITKLYEELRRGDLNKYTPSINNAMFGKLNSSIVNDLNEEIFDNKKASYYRGVMDMLLGEELLSRNIGVESLKNNPKLTTAVYNNLYNRINDFLDPLFDAREAGQPYNEELFDDLYKLTDNNNWNKFINYHKKYSKLGTDIQFDIETAVNDLFRNEEKLGEEDYIIEQYEEDDDPITETPDEADQDPNNDANYAGERSIFDFAGNEISSSNAASLETKSLIRMLKKVIYKDGKFEIQYDSNGFARLNDFSHTWNNLAASLADLPTYEDMYNKLLDNQTQIKIPEIVELLKYLPHPTTVATKQQLDRVLAFRRDFNRSQVDIFSGKITESNDFFFLQETKRNIDQIEKEWTSNFLSLDPEHKLFKDGIVLQDDDGRNYINPEVTLSYNLQDQNQRQEFLDLIGFTFSDETMRNANVRATFLGFLQSIQNNINQRLKFGQKIYNPVYDLKQDLRNDQREIILKGLGGRINAFIGIESLYSSLNPSMSYQNAEGNTIYALMLNNFLTKTAGLINNVKSYDELVSKREAQYLNYLNNPYVKNSLFLNKIFNQDGSKNNIKLIVGNYSGLKIVTPKGSKAYSTTSLNLRDKIIMDMNSLLRSGAIEIMRTESSKTAYFIKLDKYGETGYLPSNIEQFISGFNSPTFIKIMKGYLIDEIERMKNADKITLENYPKEAAKQFNLFRDILRLKSTDTESNTERLKDKIKEDIKIMSPEEVVNQNNDEIEKAIIQFFDGEYESFLDLLSDEGISRDDIAVSLRSFSTPQLYRAFIANDFILNVEYTKIFDGDTVFQAHYKDYHKRAKGAISTGHDPMVDGMFVRFMQNNEHNTVAGFLGAANLNDYITTKSLVINDDKRSSIYVDHSIIQENLKKVNPALTDTQIDAIVDKYKNMTIGDGQGHISLDFYRQFLMSIHNWSDKQELMYQKELAWFRLNYADLNPEYSEEQKSRDRNFIEKYKDIVASFTPIKMQYNGPIETTGTYAQVMDKFSVAPLIPSIIQGTPLEKQHFEMVKKGIGYSKFESGTKKFRYTAHKAYTENGVDMDLKDYNPPVHFLQFLKEQINTKSEIDEDKESIFGSQIRKLIMANVFSNGLANDKWLDIRNRYKSIIRNIRNFEKEKLYNELGLVDKDGKTVIDNLERFIDAIQRQAEFRDLNNNVRDYIQYDKDTGNVKYPLEASLNKKAIQGMLMGIIDNRLRKQKISGDMLIQVSSSGFESNNFKYKNADAKDAALYGTNGLKFYDIYTDKNGDLKTRGIQVKVSIIGFKKLLNRKHPDGQNIKTIERLNALLKDEKWLESNRNLVTMIGYRIPTQGTNSIEYMEVAEFLPEIAGNIVIPPAEIVAKSGSDFDIDKMSVFRPSFDRFGNLVSEDTIEDLQKALDEKQNANKINVLKAKYNITGNIEALSDVLEQEDDLDLDPETKQLKKEITKLRNSRKQIYSNQLIKLYSEILSDPAMYQQLITPNDTNLIKKPVLEVAKKIGKLSNRDFKINKQTGEETKEAYSGTQIYRYKNNLRKFDSLLSAKNLLGVFAVNNSFSQLLQQANVGLNMRYNIKQAFRPTKRDVRLLLLSPKEREAVMKDGRINVSSKYNVFGELKQDYFSQLINGTVDAASDDFLGYVNISYENIGVINYLLHIGVPFQRIIWFINQPVMLKYYSELKRSKDYKNEIQGKILGNLRNQSYFYIQESETGEGVERFSGDKFNNAINELLSGTTIKVKEGKKENVKIIPDNFYFSDNKLKENATRNYEDFLQKSENKTYQAAVFAYFISLQEQAQLFRNYQSVFNMDTTKMQNPMDAFRLIFKQSQIVKNGLFSKEDIQEIESGSIISPFINNKTLTFNVAKELMPFAFNTRLTGSAAKFIENSIYANRVKISKIMGTIENDWVEYIIKSFGIINGLPLTTYTNTLLLGKNSLAKRLIVIRNKYPNLLKEYSFFDRLRTNISPFNQIKQQNIEVQKLFEDTSDDQNRYITEFRRLINFTDNRYTLQQQAEIRKFFTDLATLGFLQSGFNRSPISFQELIPYEQMADLFFNALKTFKENVESNPEILKKFVDSFMSQFKSINPTLVSSKARSKQSWRGKTYHLTPELYAQIQGEFLKKAKQNQIKQLESEQFSQLNPEIDQDGNIILESKFIDNIKTIRQTLISLTNVIENGEKTLQDRDGKNKTLVNIRLLGQYRFVPEDNLVYKVVNDKQTVGYNPEVIAKTLGYSTFFELGKDNKMLAFSAGMQTRNIYRVEPLISEVDNVPVQKENLNDEVEESSPEILPTEEKVVSSGMIDFQEDKSTGYAARTTKNASADATIAVAIDFTSAGEKATKSAVEAQKKLYAPIDMARLSTLIEVSKAAQEVVDKLLTLNKKDINLNIAGNGIYTMKHVNISQKNVDNKILVLLNAILTKLQDTGVRIISIRTGGQTGVDEAGAKAGLSLGIPTTILAPKGWKFRDINGKDISNEKAFKARFNIEIEDKTSRQINSQDAKELYKEAAKVEQPQNARGLAMEYIIGGGKLSPETLYNEVLTKRDERLTPTKQKTAEEVKSRDYIKKGAKSIKEVAHNIWDDLTEDMQNRISEQDIRDELISIVKDFNKRLDIAKDYMNIYAEKPVEDIKPEEESPFTSDEELITKGLKVVSSTDHTEEELKQIEQKIKDCLGGK